MSGRSQNTIRREVEIAGISFFTGADVQLRFLPAPAHHGIAFQRVDLPGTKPIPARIDHLAPRQRRTALEQDGVTVELVEHVMAALAGLQIDNCLVQLDSPEPPGLDGSSQGFVDVLLKAGLEEQDGATRTFSLNQTIQSVDHDGSTIVGRPASQPGLTIEYHLDYGERSPVPAQSVSIQITPESFVNEIAFARTFILESEVERLRAQGYGQRTTARDLLVFGRGGVIDNELRASDECVRHKILDCFGDLALLGRELHGHFEAYRTGHSANHAITQQLRSLCTSLDSDVNVRDTANT